MFTVLWIVATLTFVLMHSIPGDPLAHMAKNLPEQTKKNYYAKYGLDKPIYIQYGKFISQAIRGDLGESIRYPGRSVTGTIKKLSVVSGVLGGQALFLGFSIGIILGIIAALNRNKWPDYLVMFIAILGITVPVFVTAAVFQYFFSVKLPWFPTTGWGGMKYMVLPVVTLCFGSVATYARYMRSSVLEVINQDYILTAQAKGVSGFNVIRKHVLRNAILPTITILGPSIAGIFVGSFVVESIFGIPGLGFYFISSINDRDFTMIMGNTIFYTGIFIFSLLITDIVYSLVDPRIRISEEGN